MRCNCSRTKEGTITQPCCKSSYDRRYLQFLFFVSHGKTGPYGCPIDNSIVPNRRDNAIVQHWKQYKIWSRQDRLCLNSTANQPFGSYKNVHPHPSNNPKLLITTPHGNNTNHA